MTKRSRRGPHSPSNRGLAPDECIRKKLIEAGDEGVVCRQYELPAKMGRGGRDTPQKVMQVIGRMKDVRIEPLPKGSGKMAIYKITLIKLWRIRWRYTNRHHFI